jgi:hypothetical protein
MKKLKLLFLALMLLAGFNSANLKANAPERSSGALTEKGVEHASSRALYSRLKVIRELSRHKLSSTEKKELRKEVLTIKAKYERGPVIYISAGALILIIILLIILL